jgi:hypothetical protein
MDEAERGARKDLLRDKILLGKGNHPDWKWEVGERDRNDRLLEWMLDVEEKLERLEDRLDAMP